MSVGSAVYEGFTDPGRGKRHASAVGRGTLAIVSLALLIGGEPAAGGEPGPCCATGDPLSTALRLIESGQAGKAIPCLIALGILEPQQLAPGLPPRPTCERPPKGTVIGGSALMSIGGPTLMDSAHAPCEGSPVSYLPEHNPRLPVPVHACYPPGHFDRRYLPFRAPSNESLQLTVLACSQTRRGRPATNPAAKWLRRCALAAAEHHVR